MDSVIFHFFYRFFLNMIFILPILVEEVFFSLSSFVKALNSYKIYNFLALVALFSSEHVYEQAVNIYEQ